MLKSAENVKLSDLFCGFFIYMKELLKKKGMHKKFNIKNKLVYKINK